MRTFHSEIDNSFQNLYSRKLYLWNGIKTVFSNSAFQKIVFDMDISGLVHTSPVNFATEVLLN